ncbi:MULTISPECIES: MFS transporter [Mycobacteriaceae]|uniref:MFS transporter n=1 Tax=Mycolicibacterium neoaurum VKM Ac-1815D TaxID=700508 RepID=V5XHC3_MYCNE|nr:MULTISPECIES: MFS transporter [Mycobacteriaceae]AXK74519.1 DHA2 family efflux MFS transporter permease subunit [Mycolicibacterium neoaurum]
MTGQARPANPWHALWAMLVGFFMILVDSTIVAIANKPIMDALGTDYDGVIWVTSAYLLAYAVPLLVAGRLGDRFGPKNLYLIGLGVFTAASLWCGLAGSIEMLIAARVVQGLGAALLTPQTLSTITRLFPAARRGVAMSVWGATAGVATLVGPIAGGVLIDGLGWQWIFFVNVPIGIIGIGLAMWLVPSLPTERHDFDLLGVALSGLAMFFIVFGLQEGQSHDWAPWIWATMALGCAFLVGFVYWQSVNPREPLIPLRIFADRDFTLSTVGVAVISFTVTAMILPVMFYAPVVLGLSYTRSALLTAPMAIASGALAPFVGRMVDRKPPTPIIGFGFSLLAIGLTWLSFEMTPSTAIWRLLLPLTVMGVGMAFVWSPLAATATRNLPPESAGAGSGVYNSTRQVGAVLGSAAMAAFMTSRIGAELGGGGQPVSGEGPAPDLPSFLEAPFSAALAQSLLLPAFIALFGVVGAIFLRGGDRGDVMPDHPLAATPLADQHSLGEDWADGDHYDDYDDDYADDEYMEWSVSDPHADMQHDMPTDVVPAVTHEFADEFAEDVVAGDDSVTDQLSLRHGDTGQVASGGPLGAHRVDDSWSAPAEDWSSLPVARPARGRHSRGD